MQPGPLGRYQPTDKGSKTNHPVIGILCKKYPEPTIPPDSAFDVHDDADKRREISPVYCFKETMAKYAGRLQGVTGPSGVTGLLLKSW